MSEIPEAKVFRIDPKKIEPNPDNPRRIFDEEDMETLKKSIKLRGVMVPLIIFRKQLKGNEFVLLDGERRLKCAKELGLKSVPANEIQKPSRAENIIRMFNIHNVRAPWELVPMAFSLETLIKLLEKEGKRPTNSELSKITGMPVIRISECKRILKYKTYLHLSLDSDPKKRIGGDFFSQLDLVFDKLKQYPDILNVYPKRTIIQIMIKRKQDGTIDNFIKEFRTLRKILTSDVKGVEKQRIVANVNAYLEEENKVEQKDKTKTKNITIEDLYERTSSTAYLVNEIIKTAKTLDTLLLQIKLAEVKNKKDLSEVLNKLIRNIEKVLHD